MGTTGFGEGRYVALAHVRSRSRSLVFIGALPDGAMP
jgi:hypothetical protein